MLRRSWFQLQDFALWWRTSFLRLSAVLLTVICLCLLSYNYVDSLTAPLFTVICLIFIIFQAFFAGLVASSKERLLSAINSYSTLKQTLTAVLVSLAVMAVGTASLIADYSALAVTNWLLISTGISLLAFAVGRVISLHVRSSITYILLIATFLFIVLRYVLLINQEVISMIATSYNALILAIGLAGFAISLNALVNQSAHTRITKIRRYLSLPFLYQSYLHPAFSLIINHYFRDYFLHRQLTFLFIAGLILTAFMPKNELELIVFLLTTLIIILALIFNRSAMHARYGQLYLTDQSIQKQTAAAQLLVTCLLTAGLLASAFDPIMDWTLYILLIAYAAQTSLLISIGTTIGTKASRIITVVIALALSSLPLSYYQLVSSTDAAVIGILWFVFLLLVELYLVKKYHSPR